MRNSDRQRAGLEFVTEESPCGSLLVLRLCREYKSLETIAKTRTCDGNRHRAITLGRCWQVRKGKFFYFQPGHETNPILLDENVQKIMLNAVRWAAPAQ